MGNLLPSVLWPEPPGLPEGAHVWVIGGDLGAGVACELVAADHVIAMTRHPVGGAVERLAPATLPAAGRQYQLRIRSGSRTDIIGVWTVVEPAPAPVVARCEAHGDGVAVTIVGTAIIEVADAVAVVSGDAVIAVPGLLRGTVRVHAGDGEVLAVIRMP